MYQRFFQLDGSMTREYGGLGVGLAICRQLVELLGGRLTHRSEPGRGSRFQLDVEFDIATPQRPATPIAPRESSRLRQPQDCSVLLVDDSNVNQLVMRGMLLKLGFPACAPPTSGSAAMDLLQPGETFDAVLVDCQLQVARRRFRVLPDPGLARATRELPVFVIALGADLERCATRRA